MIYKPANTFTLAERKTQSQIRIGLQGFPGTGKTWAALTFPNPVVINFDRGLGAHSSRTDVIEVPFYDIAFCKTLDMQYHPSKLKDILVKWLETEGRKLGSEQTLVIDGNTGLQNAYHRWYEANKMLFLTKSGTVNEFSEWTVKRTYFGEIMEILKSLQCNVVYICHEIDLKDKNGITGPSYSGKVRPLLTGSFGDEIISHFTDWFRCHASDKPKADELTVEYLLKWGIDKKDFMQYMTSFPRNTMYYWQTESDNLFDGKTSTLSRFPRFIPADYKSFARLMSK